MKPDLQRLPQPWMTEGPAAEVMRALTAEGDQARFVGGCVRDALVGRNIRDIDIATPLSPQRVTELLHKAGLKAVPTGIDHGTVTAVADKTGVEVTTLRRDVETDGRHAKVEFTDNWQADAARRDLTINALSADAAGKVHDYFGGLDDLAAGRVRFVGDPKQRIVEDYLRLLRFFRFHAFYGAGDPDASALAACRAAADAMSELSKIDGVRLIGTAKQKTSVVSFIVEGVHPQDIGILLDNYGIAVRTGHHCCQPLMNRLEIPGTVRASFGMYNTKEEVDELVNGVEKVVKMLK